LYVSGASDVILLKDLICLPYNNNGKFYLPRQQLTSLFLPGLKTGSSSFNHKKILMDGNLEH
jgi:hypothetical protein